MPETLPPLTADDRQLIEELLSTYVLSLDVEDTDTTVSLFTEDGEFRVYDRAFAGHDGLRRMFTAAANGLHLGGRSLITATAEGAGVRQQLIFYPADRSEHRLAIYDDEVVKIDGRWLFRSRTCRFMNAEGKLQSRP
jgi:SnoaL-like domain